MIVLSLFIVHRKKCSINICVLFDVLLICLRTLALEFLLIIIYKLFTMLTLKKHSSDERKNYGAPHSVGRCRRAVPVSCGQL